MTFYRLLFILTIFMLIGCGKQGLQPTIPPPPAPPTPLVEKMPRIEICKAGMVLGAGDSCITRTGNLFRVSDNNMGIYGSIQADKHIIITISTDYEITNNDIFSARKELATGEWTITSVLSK